MKKQYENFNASSTDSLDSIFNRLQKLVSRLAILGVVITAEDLNSKFLRSLPPEWNTHVVVWMNKADIETMSINDLYNNFKIVEQEVKKSIGASTGTQNLVFMTASSNNSTNNVNTANSEVSTVSTNTASTENSTANLSNATVYAFLTNQPKGSQLVHEDLEQIHDDDLEEMDLKWQLALLSMRARRPRVVNTARPYTAPINTIRAKGVNVVKPLACWVWRPTRPNGASLGNPQLNDKGFVNSGCSRHMTGNIAYLSNFKEFDRGHVTFGGGAYGGRISGKGTLKTDSLDFDDLPDESQILLKIPRKDNMYSFDMKNIILKESLTCLVAKAALDKYMLWEATQSL
ncbi:hypothetical protein Tco_1267697, partial [Tanacetum coccineum]